MSMLSKAEERAARRAEFMAEYGGVSSRPSLEDKVVRFQMSRDGLTIKQVTVRLKGSERGGKGSGQTAPEAS